MSKRICNNLKKILISHNSKDKEFCEVVVTLLERIGLTNDEVICTSVTGYGVPLDEDIYEWLAKQFNNDLFVIFMLSDNYYDSPPSLNEMGAAWVMKKKYISIILPGFNIDKVQGAVNPRKMAFKLENTEEEIRQKLTELRGILVKEFNLEPPNEIIWNRTVRDFIQGIYEIKKVSPKEKQERLDKYGQLLLAYASKEVSIIIEEYSDVLGHHLIIDNRDFMQIKTNSAQEELETRWLEAIDKLLVLEYIVKIDKNESNYKLTSEGRIKADEIIKEYSINTDNPPESYLTKKSKTEDATSNNRITKDKTLYSKTESLFTDNNYISISQICETLNIPRETAQRIINVLIKEDKIEKIGMGKDVVYRWKK